MPAASPEASPVHLVLGDAAAGCLRASWGFPGARRGEVLVFRDVLALGPLEAIGTPQEGASRAAYWQEVMPGSREDRREMSEEADRYAVAGRLAAQGAGLILWHGDHASSVLWLQRLASVLPAGARLAIVDASKAPFAPRPGAIRALGQVAPARVAELQPLTFIADRFTLLEMAKQWRENSVQGSALRRFHDGRVSHHDAGYYDELLLARCTTDWQPAPRVIGEAMEAADEVLGDWFFAWRLRQLAQAGRLVMEGEYGEDLAFRVRLP